MSGDPFEFPQHLRKLTESNVELARAAYAQFVEALTQATDVCLNSMPQNEMTAGLKVAQGQLIRFGKQNVEAGLNLASDLANAKSLPKMLDIQTAYADPDPRLSVPGAATRAPYGERWVELAAEEVRALRR